MHSPKILTIQKGWPRGVRSIGNSWQALMGYKTRGVFLWYRGSEFLLNCARVWQHWEVARFTLLYRQNFMRVLFSSSLVNLCNSSTFYEKSHSWWFPRHSQWGPRDCDSHQLPLPSKSMINPCHPILWNVNWDNNNPWPPTACPDHKYICPLLKLFVSVKIVILYHCNISISKSYITIKKKLSKWMQLVLFVMGYVRKPPVAIFATEISAGAFIAMWVLSWSFWNLTGDVFRFRNHTDF